MTDLPTVVCVLRRGGEYKCEHVEALYESVVRWWPYEDAPRFVVLSDAPVKHYGIESRLLRHSWPGWWSKMELFAEEHYDLGPILYFDLDTMLVGWLDDISASTELTLLQDFYKPERVQSGMMLLPVWARRETMAAWWECLGVNDPTQLGFRGDGEFLDSVWRHSAYRWQEALPGAVVSFKKDIRQVKGQVIPFGAKVVCFHGKPRPWHTRLWERERLNCG